MKTVFVDSSAFFALLVSEDESYDAAQALFQRARAERWRLLTTNVHVFETYALLLNRVHTAGRDFAISFLDYIERGLSVVERMSDADEADSKNLVRKYKDKTFSLCDALSFVVMERLGIREALTFDDDFRSYGRIIVLQS